MPISGVGPLVAGDIVRSSKRSRQEPNPIAIALPPGGGGSNPSGFILAQGGDNNGSAPWDLPFVPDNLLPPTARAVLAGNRTPTVDPDTGEIKVIFVVPIEWPWRPSSWGGGILANHPSGSAIPGGDLISGVRIQPPGTSSGKTGSQYANLYPNGYFVVTNSLGQAISIYTGQPASPSFVHNPIGAQHLSPF